MDHQVNFNFHEMLHDALKMLGFEKYQKSNKNYNDIEFSSSTFLKSNQRAFEVVTFFLFNQLKNGSDYTNSFRGCYPCLDRTHESNFRKNVINSFKKLEKDALFNYKFLPGIIHNPGGDSFVTLYLAFANYVLKKSLNEDKLSDYSNEELALTIEDSKSLLMDNCMKLHEKTLNDEKYCAYFDAKFESIKQDEQNLKAQLKALDKELITKYGTTDTDKLLASIKENFDQIKSHKLKTLLSDNEEVLKVEIADIENRSIDLRNLVHDSSQLPIDLFEIKQLFQKKLNSLEVAMDQDNSNIEAKIQKLDLKDIYYSSNNRILKALTNDLEKKIDFLQQQTYTKKRAFLQREEVQDLIRYVKSKLSLNPPKLEFKPEKFEKSKPSLTDLNLTTMDQTISNRSTLDEELNLSINLAEMTNYTDYPSNDNEESYLMSNHQTRNFISQIPDLDNINE